MWVAWNGRIARERQALLKLGWDRVSYHHVTGTRVNVPKWMDSPESVIRAWESAAIISANAKSFPATQGDSLSWLRRRMGDFPIVVIKTSNPELVQPIRKWFPEAVCVLDENSRESN